MMSIRLQKQPLRWAKQLCRQAQTILLLVLLTCTAAFGQGRTNEMEPGNLFQKAINLYNGEKYWEAQLLFEQLANLPRNSNRLYTVSQFMLIKCHYRLGDWEGCQQLGQAFLQQFPNSRYASEVQFTLAELALAREKYQEAFRLYLAILPQASANILNKSDDALTLLINDFLSLEELQRQRDLADNDFTKKYLTIRLAEAYHLVGDTRQANRELHSLDGKLQHPFLRQCYSGVESKLKKAPLPPQYIGVILPLSGPNANIGQKILNGLKFALSQHRQKFGNVIGAIVIDNRSEVGQTVRAAETLAKNPRVVALFGPVTSEAATAMALIANMYQIPMVTPTASSSQLTTLSPYVFQANLDYENIGRFLALYRVKSTHIKTVASISPVDEFGKEVTDAFCRTFDELGGQVISQQWYLSDPVDLKHQVNAIRLVATEHLQAELNQKIGLARQQLTRLVRENPRYANDTVRYVVGDHFCYIFKPDTTIRLTLKEALIRTELMRPDEFEIPKRDTVIFSPKLVDGFLFPSRAVDVSLILPQLQYYDIRVPIFGSANWSDPQLLKGYQTIQQNLRLISDFYYDPDSRQFRNFATSFKQSFNSEPGRFELYGYDTMSAILKQMETGPLSRKQLYQSLIAMPIYRGIARNISFQGNRPRVNSCAFILGFERNRLVPVATVENGQLLIDNKMRP